ncbi:hypothetical protein PV682_17040 [Streptomyces niveiscabiei]|uniref:hypothetical protein n=1 Tax=Streptomyces niveiscabiei TaxID=164115 RepID=UPI0029AF08EB|nr:hypothetical protein [Streptomyces niveiscabiei]MDX3383163.1 hypothetical protein [Streptomyces niveiscabiei]
MTLPKKLDTESMSAEPPYRSPRCVLGSHDRCGDVMSANSPCADARWFRVCWAVSGTAWASGLRTPLR